MNTVTRSRAAVVDAALDQLDVTDTVSRTKGRLLGAVCLGDEVGVELKVRRVRTPAGSARYGLPIGSPITRDAVRRARSGGGGRGRGGSGGETRRGPESSRRGPAAGSGGGGRARTGTGGGRSGGGSSGGGGGGRGGGGGAGGAGGALGGLAGLAGLLGQLLGSGGGKGKKPKKPRKPKKGKKPKKGGSGGGNGNNGGNGGRSPGSGGGNNGNNGGGDTDTQPNPGTGGRGGSLSGNMDRGRRDHIGKKTLPSVQATRERLEVAVKNGDLDDIELKTGQLYFFSGRNTAVAAPDAATARKRKRRGGDEIVTVRKPNEQDRRDMRAGRWTRTRRDGKTPEQSRYGHGRGQGPPRK